MANEQQPKRWRCLVEGCDLKGAWQPILPGETYLPPSDPKSHYFRVHYTPQEAAYRAKVDAQRAERMEHYRLTGEFLPPKI
jgi:hypothetical protein